MQSEICELLEEKNKEMSTQEIAIELGVDIKHVHRALCKLFKFGTVYKRKIPNRGRIPGGFKWNL